MRTLLLVILALVLLAIAALAVWRQLDRRADRTEMARLIALQPRDPPVFSPRMVAELPDPARRFFLFAIAPGTPLSTVARIDMKGRFAMGDRADPRYAPMRATQVLAAPDGFVWSMSRGGAMRLSGSDSGSWTRFWLYGLIPVARLGGDADHRRAAFGRYIAEAVFWTPAAVLPGPNVSWAAVSGDVARVTMRHGDLEQSVDLTVDAAGRPRQVSFMRWSDANRQKVHRLQPFGGHLSQFRRFAGFTLPTHVEAGNMFGTAAYFPFFIAKIEDVVFPKAQP